ncbi:hypothetical protein [Wolbachia endosymbiont (group A) of Apoderus coryli]|uniref:hypothetical protein n=1 Tax=Wolbachia endosymbiont (group A) of Apoderus coryli TaxID=2953980 RepID=UPI00222EA7D2|nr:hypothetical protein [Wolbachia endosymbiont (group A) of Apoderus coryli]
MLRYRAQLYEHSFLKVNCTANGVIPVLDTGIQLFHPRRQRLLLLSSQCLTLVYFMMMS